jgi:hypothetical protein
MHTGDEKPFCSICVSTYTQADSLNQHAREEHELDIVSVNSSMCTKEAKFSSALPGAATSEMCSTSAQYLANHETRNIESQTCNKASQYLNVMQRSNRVGSSERCEKDVQYTMTVSQQIEMIKPQSVQALNIENKDKNT